MQPNSGPRAAYALGDVVAFGPPSAALYCAFLLAILAIAAITLTLVYYPTLVPVQGSIRPMSGEARILAPMSANVLSIHVLEGESVDLGEPIVTLQAHRALVSGEDVASRVNDQLNERLSVLRSQQAEVDSFYAATREQLHTQRRSLLQEAESIERQLAIEANRLAINQERVAMVQELVNRGVSPMQRLREVQGEILSFQSTRETLEYSLQRANNSVEEIDAQLTRLAPEQNREVYRLMEQILATELEITRAAQDGGSTLIAPMRGTIGALLAREGEIVEPGTMLATLLPGDGDLIAELWAPSSAIGAVDEGQEVRLNLAAFPSNQFGHQMGRVVAISDSIIRPEDVPGPLTITEPVYRVIVELENQYVSVSDQQVRLQPGMLLRADIVVRREPLWSLLLGSFRIN
ncbi:MAG: HlyD family efflux transporter periplasmic adaptor subunit [Oceanicaulis sp.]|jgi:membrane fusion protein|nr:HlyD family efflux transporter periplasmic adaptor subunit [Oceanicaulis sp.]